MSLGDLINIATVIGAIIALFSFIKGIIEYKKQGSQKRAEYFNNIHMNFIENDVCKNINELLRNDSEELIYVSSSDKRSFLGYFEEIALLMNSNIIKKEIVHYSFGAYIIRCCKSKYFWIIADKDNKTEPKKIDKNNIHWSLFLDFAKTMEQMEEEFKFNKEKYKF